MRKNNTLFDALGFQWDRASVGFEELPASMAKAMVRDMGASGLIKLRERDFLAIPELSRVHHINAMPCTNEEGQTLAIMPITGYGHDGEPLLDVSNSILAFVEEVRVLPNVVSIDPGLLPAMIGGPKTVLELAEIMAERYSASRGWDVKTAMASPVKLSVISLQRMSEAEQPDSSKPSSC